MYKPPRGVFTPLALLTALLDKDPDPGKLWTNELITFDVPIAINSWVASIGLPFAENWLYFNILDKIENISYY